MQCRNKQVIRTSFFKMSKRSRRCTEDNFFLNYFTLGAWRQPWIIVHCCLGYAITDFGNISQCAHLWFGFPMMQMLGSHENNQMKLFNSWFYFFFNLTWWLKTYYSYYLCIEFTLNQPLHGVRTLGKKRVLRFAC